MRNLSAWVVCWNNDFGWDNVSVLVVRIRWSQTSQFVCFFLLYPPRRMTISMFQVLYFRMLLGPHFCPSFSFTISPCHVSWPCGATLGFSNPTPVHKMHPECQLASLSQCSFSQSWLKAREQHGAPSWRHNSHRYCLLTTVTGKHRETPPHTHTQFIPENCSSARTDKVHADILRSRSPVRRLRTRCSSSQKRWCRLCFLWHLWPHMPLRKQCLPVISFLPSSFSVLGTEPWALCLWRKQRKPELNPWPTSSHHPVIPLSGSPRASF